MIRKSAKLLLAATAVYACFSGGRQAAHADTYRLAINENTIALIGRPQAAVLADGSLPAPTLHWREGEQVTLRVTNNMQRETSIHWHGIVLPYDMDGVPGISFDGIAPGQTFTYRFPVKQSGTYWYHGHSGMQEQQGLFGAIIIEPIHPRQPVDRDYVVLLSDWPEADPHRTLARLKKQSDYYNFQKRTVGDFFLDIERLGFWATVADRLAWGEMRMEPTDIADVTGATYHFLVNGQTPAMHKTYLFRPGEKIKLRFINASAMTHFDVRMPGLKMQVIAADGQPVAPVAVEEFRIAVAETYDVLVEPQTERAYGIFAEAMDRSGYAHASLTPRNDVIAEVPPPRPMTLLTLAEMAGAHAGHTGHVLAEQPPSEPANPHAGHDAHAAKADPRAGHAQQAAEPGTHAIHPLLNYRDLQAVTPEHALMGPPDREITLRLTGNMNRYIWSFDDVKYSDAEPIRVKFGERIRFTYINETMMNHPIHLHGLWQYLDNGNGMYNPKKHVINVKPGQTVSVEVLADAEGEWAFHCHLLYHMDTGMFRKLIVERAADHASHHHE
ncbi:copper resistance system multicopper oxidase [Methylomonas sp. SURF-2]|uniref:Copper resistance system multicopper oxidase n=1 Tax=Methylomonas subterranea TaxID=2952225 RepID=A0ABT1TGS8_9GAMM|nr:copper resistance system multicopper oxidase [Methylomonas sp. SURF-2]MCQ8104666.1 copper resistance system multicopper oxidase [Methylomonas sp. SURF-2]